MGFFSRSARLCVLFLMAVAAGSFASGFSISVITVTPSIRERGKFLAKNDALDILRATESLADQAISLLEAATKGCMKISAGKNSPPLPAGCSVSAKNLLGLVQLNLGNGPASAGQVSPMAVVFRVDVAGVQTDVFFHIKDDILSAFRENVKSICPPAAPKEAKTPPSTVNTQFSTGLSTTGQGGSEAKVATDGDFLVQSDGGAVSKAFGTTLATSSTNQGQISTSSTTDALANGNAAQGTQTIALNAQGIGLGQGTANSLVSTQLGSAATRSSLPTTAASSANFVVFGSPFKVNGLLSDTAQSGGLTFPSAIPG